MAHTRIVYVKGLVGASEDPPIFSQINQTRRVKKRTHSSIIKPIAGYCESVGRGSAGSGAIIFIVTHRKSHTHTCTVRPKRYTQTGLFFARQFSLCFWNERYEPWVQSPLMVLKKMEVVCVGYWLGLNVKYSLFSLSPTRLKGAISWKNNGGW